MLTILVVILIVYLVVRVTGKKKSATKADSDLLDDDLK
jgi:hypothetical protein